MITFVLEETLSKPALMLDGFLNFKKCSLCLCQLPAGAGNYFLLGSTIVMMTFALFSQYLHKILCYRRGKVRNLYEIFNEIARNFVLLLFPWS